MLTLFRNTENLDPRSSHDDNRYYADAPLSGRLCLRVPRRVRYGQPPLPFISLNVDKIVSGLAQKRMTNNQ